MSMKNKKFSRRQALNLGVGSVVGAQAGLNLSGLVGNLLPNFKVFDKLRQVLISCDSKALAQAVKPLTPPLVQLVIIDKQIEPGMFQIPTLQNVNTFDGNLLNGFELNNFVPVIKPELFAGPGNELMGYGSAVLFRETYFTKLFGNILRGAADGGVGPGLPDNYSLAFLTKGQKNGNHTVTDANMGRDKGNLASVFEQEAKKAGLNTGILGPVIFNIRSGATGSATAAFTGPGGAPMPSFASASEVRQTLRNSVAALNAEDKFKDFRRSLDHLASNDDKTLDDLEEIRKRTNGALDGLATGLSESKDFVDEQLATIMALYDAGLSANFGIVVPCTDTNGGNSIMNRGGQYGLCPVEATALVAHIMVRLANWNSEVRFRIDTDGTRSSNWGDQGGRIPIIGAPKSVLNDGVYGPIPGAKAINDLGSSRANDGTSYKTNGNTNLNTAAPMHDQALVASLMGLSDEQIGVKYPAEYQGKKIKK